MQCWQQTEYHRLLGWSIDGDPRAREPGNLEMLAFTRKELFFLSSKVRVELRGFYSFLMFLEILNYFELRKMIISWVTDLGEQHKFGFSATENIGISRWIRGAETSWSAVGSCWPSSWGQWAHKSGCIHCAYMPWRAISNERGRSKQLWLRS